MMVDMMLFSMDVPKEPHCNAQQQYKHLSFRRRPLDCASSNTL